MTQRISSRRRQRGFLLLTVVVMIAVASLLLARIAGTSLRVAASALADERQVRQRWAEMSLRRYALLASDQLLIGKKQEHFPSIGGSNTPVLWKDVKLAGATYRIILSDESAKLNLVSYCQAHDENQTRRVIDSLVSGRVQMSGRPDLKSVMDEQSMRWESWLDSRAAPASRTGLARQLAAATQRMTLWGDGRLNVCRCDEKTLNTLWQEVFGRRAPDRLLELRTEKPTPKPARIIAALGLRDSQAETAKRWIKTSSDCFSVWIFNDTDRRVSSSLFLEWTTSGGVSFHRGYEY